MEQASGNQLCPRCGAWKLPHEFYNSASRTRRRDYACRDCERSRAREQHRPMVDFVNALKAELGCVDCGYREHVQALEFDHLPGVVKVSTISKMARGRVPLDVLKAEIAKCELVCANCHRVRTTTRGDSSRGAYSDLRRRQIEVTQAMATVEQLAWF